jgi:hypothetical protein
MNEIYDSERAASSIASRWWKGTTGRPESFRLYTGIQRKQGRVLVSIGREPARILAQKGSITQSGPGWWLAQVTMEEQSADGPRRAEVTLLRWVLADDGKIKQRSKYEEFVEQFSIAIS